MSSYLRNLFGGSSSPNTMHPTSSSTRSSRPQARRAHSYQAPPPPIYAAGAPMAKASSRTSNRSARSGASVHFSNSPVEMSFPVIPPLPRGVSRSRASSMSASGHGHTGSLAGTFRAWVTHIDTLSYTTFVSSATSRPSLSLRSLALEFGIVNKLSVFGHAAAAVFDTIFPYQHQASPSLSPTKFHHVLGFRT